MRPWFVFTNISCHSFQYHLHNGTPIHCKLITLFGFLNGNLYVRLIQTIVFEFHTWISASLTRNELHSSAVPSGTICHSIYLLERCNVNCSIRYLPTHLPLSSFSYCAFIIHYCSGNVNCAFNASIHSSYICL